MGDRSFLFPVCPVSTEPKINPGRKAPTKEVLLDNAMGMSLSAIAYKYDVATSSIAQRLRQLNVPPADTRRAFMDFVLSNLPPEIFQWLRTEVSTDYPIRELVIDAIISLYREKTNYNEQPHSDAGSLQSPVQQVCTEPSRES